jgi:hypothetical protein
MEREHRARVVLEEQIEYWMPENMDRTDVAYEIDAFRSAVRAALVAEMQAEPSVPSGEGGYVVRLPDSICEDADEVQSALAAGMVDAEGNSTVPLVYLTDEMCERAARVFKWVLESDEVAAPPQDRVSEARIGIESHLGLHQVVELRYLVDCFEAVLLTQDGDKLVARGTGTNVADAMEQLLAAIAPETTDE